MVQQINQKYLLSRLKTYSVRDFRKENTVFLVFGYAILLMALSVFIQIPTITISQSSTLTISELTGVLFIFGFGCWIGYSWNDVKLREHKGKLIKASLSTREKQVAELLIQGLSNQEICQVLFIENNTVKTHLRHIYKKSNCKGRNEFRNLFVG